MLLHGSNLVIKNADMLNEIRDGKLAKTSASDAVIAGGARRASVAQVP